MFTRFCRTGTLFAIVPFTVLVSATACATGGGFLTASVVYSEPPVAVYEVPVDRVVVMSREVLVSRGYVVYRVQNDGANRIIWARHGNDQTVRIFVTPQGRQVQIRGVEERREGRSWKRHDPPREVVNDIDQRVRGGR